jgi:threonine-phosphate decarboxylase
MIDGHGDDAWKYPVPIHADFSSNVLYGELDGGLLRHIRECVGAVTHYPEAGARRLQAAAANAYRVDDEQVLVTNGATEAIYLIAQAFRRRQATIYVPAFAEYEDACAAQEMKIVFRDWEELRTGKIADEGLVFLCHPNNPTGAGLSLEFLRNCRKAIVVVDESYIEFTRAASSIVPRLHELPNVLVLRSLTKAYRIPGLRVGFVVGAASLVARLRALKMPWSVNQLALAAGTYIFDHPEDLKLPVEQLLAETAAWRQELREATGWTVHPTDTHYFLIDTPAPMKMPLLIQYGLLVRDASNFRGLERAVIRVACQSRQHNQLLTEALRACAQTGR